MRAARGLLGWTQGRLSHASGLALSTIKRMENSDGKVRGNAESVWRVQAALGDAGVMFIAEDGDGPGVRLKKGAGGTPDSPPV